ncbi:phosphate signaling complex protein PhoU [Peptoniphilus sp. KCTC 25270]|uniref:phosphate signaling complex protein PhoU n=1 Tax=Peptoniphilus sp. KCTC 25270 TaxID=2897414 RepID=UPI001E3EF5DA|nr:phosphate signaling complex protein PhoU [Peptoniphilus sp. KCTC 25270]MCD1146937.1 phosphate signaling complex protein PhoU [Peptoniphilus sp. KCTC 25270]
MRKVYEGELQELNSRLIEMASMVEKSVADSLKALSTRNMELAEEIIIKDQKINEMERKIESMCLNLLLRQQPVAGDLRFISAALKIITDLERIGDHAQDISEISLSMPKDPLTSELHLVMQMFEESSQMIKMAIDSYITKDEDLANICIARDEKVDELLLQVRRKVIRLLQDHSEHAEELIDLLQIAKYLERVGDHAENIAEWVIYSLTGNHKYYEEKNIFGE